MLHRRLDVVTTSLLVAIGGVSLSKFLTGLVVTRIDHADTVEGGARGNGLLDTIPSILLHWAFLIIVVWTLAGGRRHRAPHQRRFWQALLRLDHVIAGSVLKLASGASLLGDLSWGCGLLVRHSYRGLFDRMMSLHASGTNRKFLITGTPGIGKSFFIIPLMYWLVKEKGVRKIVLDISPSVRYLFSVSAGGFVDVVQGERAAFAEELEDPEVWWIVDMGTAENRPANTVLLSSLDRQRYKAFLKLRGATNMFMPVWKDEEIEKCRSELLPTLPAVTVRAAQSKWGNIPRYVLEKVDDVPAQELLDVAMKSKDCWENVMLCIGEPDSAPAASHKLVHLHVVGDQYNRKVMKPASSYVMRTLEESAGRQHVEKLKDLVHLSMDTPAFASAGGAFFEHYTHRCLQKGGVFKVRRLDTRDRATSKDLHLETAETLVFNKVEDMKEKDDNVYCMPRVHNFPAVDAIMQPRYLFQMTITQKREISLDGLRTAVRQLRGPKKQLYFAVPSSLFSSYRCVSQVPHGIEQWVLEVPWI